MLLHKAYIGLHLETESKTRVKSCLESQKIPYGLVPQKSFHLTLDYFGDIDINTLEKLADGTRAKLLTDKVRNSYQIILGNPEHFVSNVTEEDIFYLPAVNEHGFFSWLKSQEYSICTPHVTILKGENLAKIQVNKTLNSILNIIPSEGLFVNIMDVFCHGKTESGEKFEKIFSV